MSAARSTRLSSQLGLALAVAFTVCFLTGLLSHLVQHPPVWFGWPARPVGLYRVTQGVHVATGLATVPLLGAKLWSVCPRLFPWPPVRGMAHAAERLSVAALVASALFLLASGILNVARWYAAMPFAFTAAHYRVAWLSTGALLVHVGVQLPVIRAALARPADRRATPPTGALTRRRLFGAVGVTAGVITLTTAGQTVAPLAPVSVLAPRRPDVGPQGLPVNRSAAAARVVTDGVVAGGDAYRLIVTGPQRTVSLSLADLHVLGRHAAVLPIACVEGWSATGRWTGVRLRDLAALVGADPEIASARIESLEPRGRYRTCDVPSPHLRDPLTLIATHLGGEPLHPDHGFPARLIAPNRPGVLQTKWVGRIVVRAAP